MSGWVKIPDNWLESDDIEELGADAVLLHLSALAYSSRQLSDGRLHRRALRHLWHVPDLDAAVALLEKAGEWEPRDDAWLLVNWRKHLLAADEIEHRRETSRASSERFRRHQAGDHSMCERCSAVRAGDRSRDQSRDASRDVTVTASTRNASPRLDAKQERRGVAETGGDRSGASAPTGRAAEGDDDTCCPHGDPLGLQYDGNALTCHRCAGYAPTDLDVVASYQERLEEAAPGVDLDQLDDRLEAAVGMASSDRAGDIATAVYMHLQPDPITRDGVAVTHPATYGWIRRCVLDAMHPGCLARAVRSLPDEGTDEAHEHAAARAVAS